MLAGIIRLTIVKPKLYPYKSDVMPRIGPMMAPTAKLVVK